MFNERHYVPILKWKRGEQKALEFLDAALKKNLTPLIEISPIAYDFTNEKPSKTIEQHLENIAESFQASWDTGTPLFIDLCWIENEGLMSDGTHPLEFILKETRPFGIKLIPVISNTRDIGYKEEVKKAYNVDQLGICIRLEDEELLDMKNNIDNILNEIDIKPEKVDLIIDLKYINPDDESKTVLLATGILNTIPYINQWRTLTLAGSSFPENLSSISTGTVDTISRSEWSVWSKIVQNKTVNRAPTYGDYCISNPYYQEIDPRYMRMTANIRYTTDDEFLIIKGKQVKTHGWEQTYALSKQLVSHPQYYGKNYSWGDEYIYDCANRRVSCGNAETWRRVGTNHHLTLIVNQLASFPVT